MFVHMSFRPKFGIKYPQFEIMLPESKTACPKLRPTCPKFRTTWSNVGTTPSNVRMTVYEDGGLLYPWLSIPPLSKTIRYLLIIECPSPPQYTVCPTLLCIDVTLFQEIFLFILSLVFYDINHRLLMGMFTVKIQLSCLRQNLVTWSVAMRLNTFCAPLVTSV